MWTKYVGGYLGRYHIEDLIGRGAMGVVFRAHDPDLRRTVAIKILYPQLTADEKLVERFRLEAQTAANLRHRNIVAIYDVGYAEDLYYIVMEFLDGPSLSHIIEEQGPLPPRQVLDICDQIASALDYIHRKKLVHRDVKANNIMVDPEGRAVLTDFGLVWTAKGSTLTAEGRILGTPQYIAPEQIRGGEIGLWTDLYALGVVVYEMLTARYPFDADVPASLLFQVLWQPPPPVRSLRPELPEQIDEVVSRVLSKQPQERYPSGAAFAAALEQALDGRKEQAVEVARPALPKPSILPSIPSIPSWLWAAMGVVALLVVGALFLLSTGVFSASPPPTASSPAVVALTTSSPTPTSRPTLAVPTSTLGATTTSAMLGAHSPTPTTTPTARPPTATPVPPTTSIPTVPTATPTASRSPTPSRLPPTATPTRVPATATPSRLPPTATPSRLPTTVPTVVPTPVPTFTPIPVPTATPKPTRELPTPTVPTATPEPTDTPLPTATPEPTPTNTPVPPPTETSTPAIPGP